VVGPYVLSGCLDDHNEELFLFKSFSILRAVILLILKSVDGFTSAEGSGIGEMNHKFSKLSLTLSILEAKSTLKLLLCNPTINRIGDYMC